MKKVDADLCSENDARFKEIHYKPLNLENPTYITAAYKPLVSLYIIDEHWVYTLQRLVHVSRYFFSRDKCLK